MAVTAVERRPATWEEYEALPEQPRAEYVDGCIVVTPAPTFIHQTASRRLANALENVLPAEYVVVEACNWKPAKDEFIPDVMVVRVAEITDVKRFFGIPALCVEILSSYRSHDYITKAAKYAEAGLDHYWILDPEPPSLDVLVREGVHYRLVTTLTGDTAADVSLGIAGLTIDLAAWVRITR